MTYPLSPPIDKSFILDSIATAGFSLIFLSTKFQIPGYHVGIALTSLFLPSVSRLSFSIDTLVQAICLAYIIILPQITPHSFVSPTMPRSPVNKFLLFDQIPSTCPLTHDTYPHVPLCPCASPICPLLSM